MYGECFGRNILCASLTLHLLSCTLYLGCVPPLLEVALRQIPPLICLSFAFLDHVTPSHRWISSLHLLLGLPLDLFPSLTCHSVHLIVHLLSFMRATCPAHFHFSLVISSMISYTFVFSHIYRFGIVCISFIPSIFLSIFLGRFSIFE